MVSGRYRDPPARGKRGDFTFKVYDSIDRPANGAGAYRDGVTNNGSAPDFTVALIGAAGVRAADFLFQAAASTRST